MEWEGKAALDTWLPPSGIWDLVLPLCLLLLLLLFLLSSLVAHSDQRCRRRRTVHPWGARRLTYSYGAISAPFEIKVTAALE